MPDYFESVLLPDGLCLRAASESDRATYAELTLETLGVYAREVFGLTDDAVLNGASSEFDPSITWAVDDADRTVALVAVESRAAEVWVDHMVVSSKYQSRGIGSSLVRAIQRWAADRALSVTLSVVDGNPARQLYERLDFVVEQSMPPRTFYRWSG